MPRPGTRTATSLRKELDTQGTSNSRNLAVLMSIFLVGAVFAARQYGMLEGTPLDFLHPKSGLVAENEPAENTGRDRNPATPANDSSVPMRKNEGVIVLQTRATNYRVLVNGKQVPVNNNQFAVPLNVDLNIDVAKPGHRTARFQTRVTGQAPAAFRVDLAELPSGILFISTTPETHVSLYLGDEKVFDGQTPVRNQLVPVGTLRAVMENSLLNLRVEAEIVVEEGKITRFEKVLQNK